jgi:UDP-glucose 4-epimerase
VSGVFNIGSDQPVSILQLAKSVIAAVNPKLEVQFQSYAEAYDADFEDVRTRIPDLSKLRRTIRYRSQYDLETTIREVIESYRARMQR